MTTDEARDHIGDKVVYTSGYKPPEYGVITGVSRTSAFVLYDGRQCAQGTDPADLTLLAGEAATASGDADDDPPLDDLLLHAIRMRAANKAVNYDVRADDARIAEIRAQIRARDAR